MPAADDRGAGPPLFPIDSGRAALLAPEGQGRPRPLSPWSVALAGVGLFLAGTVLGGILVLTVVLYRAPSGPLLYPSSPVPAHTPPLPGGEERGEDPTPASSPSPSPSPGVRPVGAKVGWEAPAFTLRDRAGVEHALAAYRGRTVLVHFWASWCLPCRAEWPELLAFAGQYDPSQVVLLAVNSEETVEVVDGFVGQEATPFPVLLDGDGSVSRAYRVSALPTTFVIGPDGVITRVLPGNLGVEEWIRLVER